MSTAAAFRFPRLFPFCPANPSGSYVGSLTLSQAMAFWWNLEYAEIFTTGTALTIVDTSSNVHSVGASGSVGLVPPQPTDDWSSATAYLSAGGSAQSAPSTFGSAARAPRNRMCYTITTAVSVQMSDNSGGSGGLKNILLTFGVCLDPLNAGYYAIEYLVFMQARSTPISGVSAEILISDTNPGSNVFGSGNFTLGGISFPYYTSWGFSGTASTVNTFGGSVSGSSSFFTY